MRALLWDGFRGWLVRMNPFWRWCRLVVVAAGVMMVSASGAEREPVAWAARSGAELIQDLQQGETRGRAFYELSRRAKGDEADSWEKFLDGHRNIEVVVAPQGDGKEPIYVILYDFLSRTLFSRETDYPVIDSSELFPPVKNATERRGNRPAFDAFTAKGERITPFGGNNVLEGSLSDVNGDRILERVEVQRYGVDKVEDVQVLEILAVKPTAEPLLRVLINWGAEEWTYRLNDARGDGIADIELGPRTGESMKTEVVFRWDAKVGAYVGPEGTKGDHFRRLNAGGVHKQLKVFQSAKLTFPHDPDYVEGVVMSGTVLGSSSLKKEKPVPPAAKPYQRKSLAEVSDAELLRRMGRGKAAYEYEDEVGVRKQVPAGFWTMEPKRAALAVVEGSRSAEHRAAYELAVDDRGGVAAPETGSVSFSSSSSRCYNAVDGYYFLRVDPKGSYLAYARSWSGGVVFYSVVHDQPAFDLRLCPLSYEEARHLAQTIWWLDRVRSRRIVDDGTLGDFSMMHSTADGRGRVVLRDGAGAPVVERNGTLWSGEPSERWNGNYDHEVFVNFSGYLMSDVLTRRIGKAWTEAEPKNEQDTLSRQEHGPRYSEAELKRIRALSAQFLAWFSLGQDRVSFGIVTCAADAAGTLVMPETRTVLGKIVELAPWATVVKRADEVNEATLLRTVAQIALRKIKTDGDAAGLYSWAITEQPGCQWAMQRLASVDKARYVEALEVWMGRVRAAGARQIFEEIRRVAPERATAIAAALSPKDRGALTVSAFAQLNATGKPADEQERIKGLLEVMLAPKSGWEQRGDAIELLVPPGEPLRYPQKEVDEALRRLLDADRTDDLGNFTLARACRALALRQRTEVFDRMETVLKTGKDSFTYDRILGALVLLAQADPGRFGGRVKAIVVPELKATNKPVSELLWAVWAMDLRELKPELERLGTGDERDYEDSKASSSGGDVKPVLGRFHLARKIADVWNAEDAVTQIRVLTALAAGEAYRFAGDEPQPERVARLRAELAKAAKGLTVEQRERVEVFFKAVEAEGERETAAGQTAKATGMRALLKWVREVVAGK